MESHLIPGTEKKNIGNTLLEQLGNLIQFLA